ncbi:Binding partner of ACD11 1, partial [Cucurbita argyrosperma subsp. sororia]
MWLKTTCKLQRCPSRFPCKRPSRDGNSSVSLTLRIESTTSFPAMSVRTVKVSNVSLGASERDIMEFFSFSGDIEYLEMQSESERSQIAYVTFKDVQGAETAVLLSGATIVDLSVNITLCPEYELPPEATAAPPAPGAKEPGAAESAFRKAEDVVSGMLAKGFILGKDAVNSAKAFDEKHQLSSTASAKVATFDKKIGFTEKISAGTSLVSDKVREVDQKFQVSEKTKSAFAVAEEKVSTAGSAIMKNRYILTGTSWVTGAFSKVAKAAGEVGQKTKEKVEETEEEQRKKMVEDFAQVHLSESPKGGGGGAAAAAAAASAPPEPQQRPKPEPAQEIKFHLPNWFILRKNPSRFLPHSLILPIFSPPITFIVRSITQNSGDDDESGSNSIKMELADKTVGFLLSLTSLSIFTYYTFWVIILPFVDSDHFIHNYFLPQEYAILIPVFAGVVLLCLLAIFVGIVMLKSKKKKA